MVRYHTIIVQLKKKTVKWRYSLEERLLDKPICC